MLVATLNRQRFFFIMLGIVLACVISLLVLGAYNGISLNNKLFLILVSTNNSPRSPCLFKICQTMNLCMFMSNIILS